MTARIHLQERQAARMTAPSLPRTGVLRRTCACEREPAELQRKARSGHELDDLAIRPESATSTGLTIGRPDDGLEVEADRVADHVMRTPAPSDPPPIAPDGEEDRIRREAAIDGVAPSAPASVDEALRSPGRPLDPATRALMEPRFGHDFSRVRVHSDALAGRSAREVDARAYTVGQDIVFAAGQLAPETDEGRRLLAHELAHVVQQSGSPRRIVAREPTKDGLAKPESRAQADAVALFWSDIKARFAGDARKIAGAGYDDTVDVLSTSFQDGEAIEAGVKTARPAPRVQVGKKYLATPDVAARDNAIKAELDKIDTFRLDNARIDDDDLSNAVITGKLGSLDVFGKRDYLQKLEAQKSIKNDKVKEYVRRSMPSTPPVAGATATASGGFEVQIANVKIIVKPDVFDSPAAAAGTAFTAQERIDTDSYTTKPSFTWGADQRIDNISAVPSVPQLIYKVETHYGVGADPALNSGYGVGTRPEDAGSDKKLRFHEGTHGTVFIQYIKDNLPAHPFPVFDGQLGEHKDSFIKKTKAYDRGVRAFDKVIRDALAASEQQVDCTGKTIEQHSAEKGKTSTVKCDQP